MKKTQIDQSSSGFRVFVDGSVAKTPMGREIELPTRKLAEIVAVEWQVQGKVVRKDTMPFTQIASVAIDLIRERREEVMEDILSYLDTDAACYRAGNIPELLVSQEELLNPLVAWAEEAFAVKYLVTNEIMPLRQPPETRARIATHIASYDEWKLAVLVCVIKPLSSLILGLALLERYIEAANAFYLAHLEEEYETVQWGEDEEKQARINKLKHEAVAAGEFLTLLVA
jgi:chaperone required for assembly of F1-ATPase